MVLIADITVGLFYSAREVFYPVARNHHMAPGRAS